MIDRGENGMSTLKLWGIGTPRTLRVHWALHELGLAYDSEPVMPRSEGTRSSEYARVNASRKVPTLVDGDFVLSESGAIVNHLLRTYGGPKGLQPPTGRAPLARYDEWCFFALMELDATSTYVIRRHLDLPEVYGEAPAAIAAAREYCAQALVDAAHRLGDGPFAMGEEFSGADILTCRSWATSVPNPRTMQPVRVSTRPQARVRASGPRLP